MRGGNLFTIELPRFDVGEGERRKGPTRAYQQWRSDGLWGWMNLWTEKYGKT